MGKKTQHPQANRGKLALPTAAVKELIALYNAGEWEQLTMKARMMTVRHPGEIMGWRALGKALLQLGQWTQALTAISRLVKLSPKDANAHNELGYVFYSLGRKEEAEASYRHALKLDNRCCPAYSNLGGLLADYGRLDEAAANLRLSLEIEPDSAKSHNNLGRILYEFGRLADAEASYRRALELDPNYFDACMNLSLTLNDLGHLDASLAGYRRALEINPKSDLTLHHLGNLLDRVGREDEAMACLERSIALNPNDADVYNTMGNIFLRKGEIADSLDMFRRAQQLRPFISSPALKEKADFSVLLLDAPGPGCTPLHYLLAKAPFDRHSYCVMPDVPQDLDLLRAKADVVINMIADADSGKDILPFVLDIVERLGRPTFNHPAQVMATDRETVARRLSGIPLCRIPKTVRLAGPELAQAAVNGSLDGFSMPLLVRLAGNHGGDDFEKLDDLQAIAQFVSKRPEANYYLTEYVDYRSADGYFRKYRLISVNGELLPYHLAIHDDWKVHHFRTDMANQLWMRQEEESFLRDPQLVFNEPHQAALKAVAATSGLDYCGIDCALDAAGLIVVFETNASMLVHDEKDATFAYKNPYIARIKEAYHARLAILAAGGL